MVAVLLSDFVTWEELSDNNCILCVIAVCLFFICGWCFFDIIWRVFLHKIKFFLVLLSLCCVLSADWESDVGYIRNDVDSIEGEVRLIRDKVNFTMLYSEDLRDDMRDFKDVFHGSVTSDSYKAFFPELLYGVNMVRDSNSESQYAYRPKVPSSGYDALFGLKLGYEDLTQDYYDLINRYSSSFDSPANFNLSSFNDNRTQINNSTPDSFLSCGNSNDFLTYKSRDNEYFHASDGSSFNSRDSYTMTKINNTSIRDRQEIDYFKRWANAAANRQGVFANLDGTILQFNLDWVADYANAIFPMIRSGGSDQEPQFINWLPSWRNKTFSFSLVPRAASDGDQGTTHYLLPFFQKWQEYRQVVNAGFAVLCYGTVIIFIADKVRALVEGS